MEGNTVNTKRTYIIEPGKVKFEKTTLSAFQINEESPFDDKYDFWGERAALGDLAYEKKIPVNDPMYTKWHDFRMHEYELEQYILNNLQKKGRGRPLKSVDFDLIHIYSSNKAMYKQIGSLTNTEKEKFVLNTPHALRMWRGKTPDSGNVYGGFPGVSFIITIMRFISDFSALSNPYADLVLIEIEQRIALLQKEYDHIQSEMQALMESKAKIGITISELRSENPMSIEIDFFHAYGHLFVQLLAQYDLLVRMNSTLKSKAILSHQKAHVQYKEFTNHFISLLELVKDRWRKVDLARAVTRTLLEADNTEETDQMVRAFADALGPIPKEVLTFGTMPEYVVLKHAYGIDDSIKQRVIEQAKRLGLLTEE